MAWIDKARGKWRVRLRIDGNPTPVTDSTYLDLEEAQLRLHEVEIAVIKQKYKDPRKGRILLKEWVPMWAKVSTAGRAKSATYDSHLRTHILPYFGQDLLDKIDNAKVKRFVKHLTDPDGGDLSGVSARDVVSLLGVIMRAAIAEGRIGSDPTDNIIVPDSVSPERPFADPIQVLQLASRCRLMSEKILIVTAAYTGMRWGELTGLSRDNVALHERRLYIHPDVGSLHEVGKDLWLGPPKTAKSVRYIDLPPFLCTLLQCQMNSHGWDQVFVGARGKWLRRSGFSRRVMRPAADGNPARGLPAVIEGLHFHDLRHSHITWMTEDGIREVLIHDRAGHRRSGSASQRYRHPTPPMIEALMANLQDRWQASLAEVGVASLLDLRRF